MNLIMPGWLLFNCAIGGAVCYYLFSNWKRLVLPRKVCSIFVITVVIHQIEEYVYPAGFPFISNLSAGSTNPAVYPLNPVASTMINTLAILVFVLILWKFAEQAWTFLFISFFTFIQFMTHLSFSRTSLELFGSAGQTVLYSPGFLTAIVFFLPLAIFGIVYPIANKSLSLKNIKRSLKTVGIAILAFVLFYGVLLMGISTLIGNLEIAAAFEFRNWGYYAQFL